MGIVAYYVHVDAQQLQEVRTKPAIVFQMESIPRFKDAELFDMDKDWQVIPWLLSKKKREEQKWAAAQGAVLYRDDADQLSNDDFKRAIAEERKRLGVTSDPDATDEMPNDAALTAIEGRGTKDQRDEAITLGLGGARVFSPTEVKALSAELSKLGAKDLRSTFNREEMARWNVGDIEWLSEEDSVLEEFLIPAFTRLQAFYKHAAGSSHYVLVIYQ